MVYAISEENMYTEDLILYKNFKNGEILKAVSKIYDYTNKVSSGDE